MMRIIYVIFLFFDRSLCDSFNQWLNNAGFFSVWTFVGPTFFLG